MFTRRILFFLSVFLSVYQYGSAQEADFCDAVMAILRDAPNQFRNVHGSLKSSDASSSIFKSNIKVPGTINSRFVSSMGLFYEGALYQSSDKLAMEMAYGKYRAQLDGCLKPQGYNMSITNNFNVDSGDFKKAIFIQPFRDDMDIKKMPGHVTMEVDHNKETNVYTLIFYIFEH